MTRRVLLAGAGIGAVAAALGAWVRSALVDTDSAVQTAGLSGGPGSQNHANHPGRVGQDFWSSPWVDTAGRAIDTRQMRGRPLLVNFWATWCPPCVEEMPLLNRFYAENAVNGFQILAIAVDQADKVADFVKKNSIRFPVAVAGASGIEWSKSMGNLVGGLPYTVVLSGSGEIAVRKPGLVTQADLAQWIKIR